MSTTLPVTVNLDVYRGDTWSQTFRFKFGGAPIDLTVATVVAWMRSASGVNYPMQVTVEPGAGELTLRLPNGAELGGLPPNAPYAYDIEVTDGNGAVTTWVRGRLILQRDVTNELAYD